MRSVFFRRGLGLALGLIMVAIGAAPASAAGAAYEFSPELSLTGDCTAVSPDTIPDPGCPGGTHPPSGRFSNPNSIAVDAYGNEYVASYGNGATGRVDVFDDEGFFLTELAEPGGPESIAVDSKGTLYVYRHITGSGIEAEVVRYEPTVYEPEAGNISYGDPATLVGSYGVQNGGLAVDSSDDSLFIAVSDKIEHLDSAENSNTFIDTAGEGALNWSNWVAVDSQRRRLYASTCKTNFFECVILVFDADAPHDLIEEVDGSGTPAGEFKSAKGWLSIAVDEETGHFFVDDLEATKNVYEFDETFQYSATIQFNAFQGGSALQIAFSNSQLRPGAKNKRYLFVPVYLPAGRALAFKPPSERAPVVESAKATNIGETEALLRATIDPSGGATTYSFEYEATGSGEPHAAGGGTIPSNSQPTQVSAAISGLSPATAYLFRVVATNAKGSDEEEGEFATYSDSPISSGSCPNGSLRWGPSTLLPDCRAYELVTPADTNGRPPKGVGFSGEFFSSLQASPLGDRVSFLTEGGALPGIGGAGTFNGDPFVASRGPDGWTTVSTGPSGEESIVPQPGSTSADQTFSLWAATREGSAVINPQITRYVRYPDGHSELVGTGSIGSDPVAKGRYISDGGGHIVFSTLNFEGALAQRLEPNSPPEGTEAVYDRTLDGVTHVVSLLPGNLIPGEGEGADFAGASADGNGIAFKIGSWLYLRVANAVTYKIAANVDFAGVSEGGQRIFYVENGDLFAFDAGTSAPVAFSNTGDVTVVNVAPDGSRAYLVSPTAVADTSNPSGAVPQPGEQNLYLSEEGRIRFVGTVTQRDVEGEVNGSGTHVDGLGLWTEVQPDEPSKDPSRVTPDGSVLLFSSRANLDGDESGGFPQIYRYDSVGDRLHCVSCIPTGQDAAGGATLETYAVTQIDYGPPFSSKAFVPNLRFDGRRAFFQSKEALVSTDNDGTQDVYQWEDQGVGTCTRAGGCVNLISSGRSARANYLYGVSQSGNDVFFTTEDVLVPGDNDTSSIYDARVNGGFPFEPDAECAGEECKEPLASPPALATPAKPGAGNDNVKRHKARRCPKGKRKVKRQGKVRCVKKKQHKRQRGSTAKKGAVK